MWLLLAVTVVALLIWGHRDAPDPIIDPDEAAERAALQRAIERNRQ